MTFTNGFLPNEDVFGTLDMARRADRGGLSLLALLPDSPAKTYYIRLANKGEAFRGIWNDDVRAMPLTNAEKEAAVVNRAYKARSADYGRHCAETLYRLASDKVSLLEAFFDSSVEELQEFAVGHGDEMPDWF